MRSKMWSPVLVAAVALGVAACGSGGDGSGAGASGSDNAPVKVALIPPSGGALDQLGQNAVRGWQYAIDEVNAKGGVGGHKFELVKATTDGKPDTTVRAARKLVTQDGAKYLSGVVTSPEVGALQQQLPALGAVAVLGNGQDDALTGAGCSPNAFRATQSASMLLRAFTTMLADLPVKRWAIQAVDYSTGHTAAKVFKQAAEAAGQQVVLEQFAPLGTTEFGSHITKLANSGADGFFGLVPSADGVAFINQATQFKLFDRFKSVLSYDMVTVPNLPALGDKVVGFYGNLGYDLSAANAKNKSFVEGFKKRFGEDPYTVSADNYLAAQMLFEAIRKAGSVDPEKVKTALNDLSFDSIAGPVKVAADHQLVRPAYVGKVVRDSSGVEFKTVATAGGDQTHPQPSPDCKLAG